MQGTALTLKWTSRQRSSYASADFCRLSERKRNSDIRTVTFGRNSKQIKGWCKKNSIRTRRSLLQSLKGQNVTSKTNRANNLWTIAVSPLGLRGFRLRVHSGGSFWFWWYTNDGCEMWCCECGLDGRKRDEDLEREDGRPDETNWDRNWPIPAKKQKTHVFRVYSHYDYPSISGWWLWMNQKTSILFQKCLPMWSDHLTTRFIQEQLCQIAKEANIT